MIDRWLQSSYVKIILFYQNCTKNSELNIRSVPLWLPIGLIFGAIVFNYLTLAISFIIFLFSLIAYQYIPTYRIYYYFIGMLSFGITLGGLLYLYHYNYHDYQPNEKITITGTVINLKWINNKKVIAKVQQNQEYFSIIFYNDKHNVKLGDMIKIKAKIFRYTSLHEPICFQLSRPHIIKSSNNYITQIRDIIRNKIHNNTTPEIASIICALIIGDGNRINDQLLHQMRVSGLSHILCVSGMHMSIIFGVIYLLSNIILYCSHNISSKWNINRISSAIALSFTTIYLLISGMSPSSVRAYSMMLVIVISILFYRSTFILRNLALVSTTMLIYDLSYLFNIGFQLSFLSVLALITSMKFYYKYCYNIVSFSDNYILNIIRLLFKYLIVSIISGVFINIYTIPILIKYFKSIPIYGIIANIIAAPIVSFIIMPLCCIAVFLMPFSFESYPIQLLEYPLNIITKLAHYIEKCSYNNIYEIIIENIHIAIFYIGLAWITIWQTQIRYLGIFPLLIILSLIY